MTTDLSGLKRFATTGEVEEWSLPSQLAKLDVLAFDQALANTGWAVLYNASGERRVAAVGTIVVPVDGSVKGHEQTLRRALGLVDHLKVAIPRGVYLSGLVVHETPPVGGTMARPESSLLAAMAVRIFAAGWPVVMVQAQHAKKVLTGNARAEKKQVGEALARLGLTGMVPTNEGQRDALALAVTFLHDRWQEEHRAKR